MQTVLLIFQFIISLALIAIVILQPSKGEGFGSIGGGGQLFFNRNKGLEALLDRATTIAAVLFMLSSVALLLISR